jgi:mono/diheme cytochrome c family protein
MKNFLSIAAFALFVSLLYTAIGNVLPQLPSMPPPVLELGSSMPPDDLVAAGSDVFTATCAQCHAIGAAGRGPDLAGMGARAHERAGERGQVAGKSLDDADYIFEAICRPGDYVVATFANIMPPQAKTLSPGQIIAVTAFLQDQGGNVSVSLEDKAKAEEALQRFGCMTGSAGGGAAPVVDAQPVGTPEEAYATFGCAACHAIDSPARLIGPSLQDAGKRLDKGQLYEALLSPDATIAEGTPPYPAGMMGATLDGNGFYERMKPADYQALVDWLAGHGGKP